MVVICNCRVLKRNGVLHSVDARTNLLEFGSRIHPFESSPSTPCPTCPARPTTRAPCPSVLVGCLVNDSMTVCLSTGGSSGCLNMNRVWYSRVSLQKHLEGV